MKELYAFRKQNQNGKHNAFDLISVIYKNHNLSLRQTVTLMRSCSSDGTLYTVDIDELINALLEYDRITEMKRQWHEHYN